MRRWVTEADDVAHAGQGEQPVELIGGVAETNLAAEAPSRQLEPRKGIQQRSVRVGQPADVTDHNLALAVRAFEHRRKAVAQRGQLGSRRWRTDIHDPDGTTFLSLIPQDLPSARNSSGRMPVDR